MRKTDEFRPSASLILGAKGALSDSDYDYKLLLIERSERTSITFHHCVFPGGVFDIHADESTDWLSYFDACGVTKDQLLLLNTQQSSGRPEFMKTQLRNFPRDISLRLTAIRETFEETGILLCRSSNTLINLDVIQAAHLVLVPFDREHWQQRVHNDAKQFLELCRHLDVIPDLWALSEWSAWRTPSSNSRKYDTVYYFAALDSDNIALLLEPSEVTAAHWLDPRESWESSKKGIIWLPFLLIYEVVRLMTVNSLQNLLKFSSQRSKFGSTLFQPVYYRCDDYMFGVLPGDDLHISEPPTEVISVPGTIKQLNSIARHYHRFIINDYHNVTLASNVDPWDGHLPLQANINVKLSKL